MAGISYTYLPIKAAISLFVDAYNQEHTYYRRCKTKHYWHSVEGHFHVGVGGVSLSGFTIKAANTAFLTMYNLSPPRLAKINVRQSLTLRWHSLSGCGRAHGSVHSDHQIAQHIEIKQWWTNVNISLLAVAYLNGRINSETWNAEPEIGSDGTSNTRQPLRVYRYGYGFGPPRGGGPEFWLHLELTRPIFAVQALTAGRLSRPVANTSHRCSGCICSIMVDYLVPALF